MQTSEDVSLDFNRKVLIITFYAKEEDVEVRANRLRAFDFASPRLILLRKSFEKGQPCTNSEFKLAEDHRDDYRETYLRIVCLRFSFLRFSSCRLPVTLQRAINRRSEDSRAESGRKSEHNLYDE